MKALKIALALTTLLVSSAFAGGKGWVTSLEEAFAKAKEENKHVLAEFTGSDWCPPCIMMQKKVFSKEEFVSAASKDYVLAIIDIPRGDKALYEKNSKVLEKYEVEGVPTVILFKPDGAEYERFSASAYPSVETFLAHLKSTQ